MADIFDQIDKPHGDIFDQMEPSVQPDIFDQVTPKKPKQVIFGIGPRGFTLETEPEKSGKYTGAFARGWMRLGEAAVRVPEHVSRQIKFLSSAGIAAKVLKAKDPKRRAYLLKQMKGREDFLDKMSGELSKAGKLHNEGQAAILRNHPEWESEPPESFVDLISSPDKIAVSLLESTPVLLSAGILTAAGQPNIGVALMYATEGQEAYDQAIQDGATESEAESAYVIYGSVSAALENMQLKGIMKIGKGMYNAVLNRTTQKIAKKGMASLTWEIIKQAGKEALEEISQGIWGEATAKMVYDKSIPGGLWGFIDRRAQEGLIGGLMGVIPGVGGGIAGQIQAVEPVQAQTGQKKKGVSLNKAIEISKKLPEGAATIELKNGEHIIESMGDFTTHGDMLVKFGINLNDIKNSGFINDKGFIKTERQKPLTPTSELIEVEEQKPGEIYKGPAYRVETGFKSEGTAADVIRYEQEELGNNYGITEEQLQKLQKYPAKDIIWVGKAEKDVAKYGTPSDITPDIKGGKIVATDGEGGYLVLKKQPKRMTRKKALTLGHKLPEVLGWTEAQRLDFNKELTGKTSMKDMSLDEARKVAEALQGKIREAGLRYTPEKSPIEGLVASLTDTKKLTEGSPLKEINRKRIYTLIHDIKSGVHSFITGLERIERFLEGLDGHEEGPHYNKIWKPIKQADEVSTENTNNRTAEFIDYLEEQGIDTAIWLGKTDLIPGTEFEFTPFQKIGIYTLSQNQNSRRYLIKGIGLTENDIKAVNDSITVGEQTVADWFTEQYETQWPILQQAAAQAGIDLKTLKKEFKYTPIIRTDAALEEQEDFLSALAEPFVQESFSPEKGMLEQRKKGAVGKIELDAAIIYMHNLGRVERFVQMAPVAKKVSRILNNKQYKKALNERTFNQGSRLLNTWIKDAVKGTTVRNTSQPGKMVAIARKNGIVYAIGYNIPSALRQSLSMSNAIAVDPLMLKHIPINMLHAATPKGYKHIQDFVFENSLEVKHRSFERDLKRQWNKRNLRLRIQGKEPWSRKAVSWIRWMDRHTTVVAWKSLYDVAKEKGMQEQQAKEFADKWISRTQPMANAKDLPDFFRGGQLDRLLTTFQNQINNNGNFYAYDIIQAKRKGKINMATVGYRTMFSYVLPAMIFGMIGRGGPPRTWKEVMVDLVTYPVAPVLLVGRWIDRMIRGWGQSETIAGIGPEAAVRLGRAVATGADLGTIMKYAAMTIGAFTGCIPAQAIRTTQGAMDMYAGETDDPRRLIYSEWALEQGQKKKKEITVSRGR